MSFDPCSDVIQPDDFVPTPYGLLAGLTSASEQERCRTLAAYRDFVDALLQPLLDRLLRDEPAIRAGGVLERTGFVVLATGLLAERGHDQVVPFLARNLALPVSPFPAATSASGSYVDTGFPCARALLELGTVQAANAAHAVALSSTDRLSFELGLLVSAVIRGFAETIFVLGALAAADPALAAKVAAATDFLNTTRLASWDPFAADPSLLSLGS